MRLNLLKVLFISIFALSYVNVSASHYLGGELTWRCYDGTNPSHAGKYIFTLKLYRDCRGANFPRIVGSSTEQINFSGGANFNLTLRSIKDLTPKCNVPGATDSIKDCRPVNNNDPKRGAVEEFFYDNRNNPVQLPTTAPATGGWVFSNSNFARPPSVNLTTTGGQYLRTVMYPYIPTGATAPLPANPCYDGSPRFLSNPNTVICSDYRFTYNHLASDKEVDSLYYDWADPLTAANTAVNFVSGYSRTAPYPDAGENPANGPVTLDNTTGQLSVEAYNPTAGNYISCVKVEAWKNCQLKAEIFRDLSIVFNTDASCANNNPPSANVDLTASPNIQQIGDNYYTAVYPGDTVQFDLLATDTDLNGFQFQQISLVAVNDEIGSPFSSQTGCVSGKTPCATLTPIAPQTGYTNPIQNEVAFLWVPGCDHLASEGGCRGFTNTYPFALRMIDNGCPAGAISVNTVIVDVLKGNPDTPPLKCVNVLNDNPDVELTWEQPLLDSGLFYNYYLVYADSGNGNFGPVDTIADYNQLSTVITPGQMPPGTSTVPNRYYTVMSMSSRAGCEFFSPPSDTLQPIQVTLNQPAGGRSDTLELSWNSPDGSAGSNTYEIWVEVPVGSGNWKKFDETTQLTFSSFLQACDDRASFEIRLLDPATGCYSTSNFSNPGDFKDETNSDVIVIDSVSVSAAGLSTIGWQPTRFDDVVKYRILFNDPNTGWTVIDSVDAQPIGPMFYEWPASQAVSRAEEFRVISVDSCGNQSDDRAVVSHKTVYLRDYLNKCEGYLRMSWSNYKGFAGGIGEYKLFYVETDINGVTGPKTLAFTGSTTDTIHRINNLNSGSEYCFTLVTYDTAGVVTSSSNEVCINASVSQPSQELYIATITNNEERGSIDLTAFVDGTADVSLFLVERANDRFGPWEDLSTIAKPTAPPFVIRFSDFGANPARSYFYRVTATDSCGGRDTVSNIGRNLVAKAESNPNLTNTISWTPYEQWDGVVNRYDVYRSTNGGQTFSLVGSNDGNDTVLDDNIAAFANERVEFCYYVQAVEGNNPLGYVNDDGLPFFSKSNRVCTYQKVKMFMPNAFRPESSVPENRTFGPSLRFDDGGRYQLMVMNRWGSVVFETEDPLERWDGTENGEDLPAGVYVYKVKYATPGGSTQEERGSFTLIR